jgi:hypothetical protein
MKEALHLSSGDRSILAHCTTLLEEFRIPLAVAITEYIEAERLIPPGTTLKEAVAEHVGRRIKLQGEA